MLQRFLDLNGALLKKTRRLSDKECSKQMVERLRVEVAPANRVEGDERAARAGGKGRRGRFSCEMRTQNRGEAARVHGDSRQSGETAERRVYGLYITPIATHYPSESASASDGTGPSIEKDSTTG